MRLLIILSVILLVMISQGCEQENPGSSSPTKEREEVVSKALGTFQELITEQNYEAMGFESYSEAQVATIGEPLNVFIVWLEDLQEYQERSDPNELLRTGNQFIYPVEVEEEVRSSITLEEVAEGWEATNFGSPNLIRMLIRVREENYLSTRLSLSSYFVVRVPSMNLYFIAYRIDDELMLTPVLDDVGFGFEVGISMPADTVFTTIASAASKYEDVPR